MDKEVDLITISTTYLCRERDFYAEKGVPCPKDLEAENEKNEKMKKEEEEQEWKTCGQSLV